MNSPELMRRISKGFTESSGPGLNVLIRCTHKDVFGVAPSENEVRRIAMELNETFNPPQPSATGFAQGPGGGTWVSRSKDTKTQS
jgi:hypothetical protein